MWRFYIEKLTNLERHLGEKERERDSLYYKFTHVDTISKTNELNKSSSSAVKEAKNISSIKKISKVEGAEHFFAMSQAPRT